ncbi:MAG: acyl carrier protein [Deltaproteobacteria bacterium]|nr:acyl carrier protein [Deltaproteobacteria bacterium]
MIIETLKLEDVTAEEIGNDSPLFGDGLGLDSIDALELVVAIEKHFDVIIEDEDVGKRADALCEFIREQTVGG